MREYYVANREEKRRNALKPENKARRQSARKLRFEKNPVARLLHNYRMRVYHAVVGAKKLSRSLLLVGCSIGQLKKYLEDRFSPGMSWENYGEWHVDHVKPCASFDFVDPEQQKKCFHFSNLQPLWASDNLRKGRAYGR